MKKDEKLKVVAKWEKRRGKSSLMRYLKGRSITRQEAIEAKCYECEEGWPEGVQRCLVSDCPLNSFHPYSEEGAALKNNSS
jgi:hypothetical protein